MNPLSWPRPSPLALGLLTAAAIALVGTEAFEVTALRPLGALVVSLVVASWIVIALTPGRVAAVRSVDCDEVETGDRVTVSTVWSLPRWRPAPAGRWRDQYGSGLRLQAVERPAPGRTTHHVTAQRRGVHTIGPASIRASCPFDLARRTVQVTGTVEITVLPAVQPVDGWAVDAVAAGGKAPAQGIGVLGASTEPDVTVRPHRRGDPLARVHWKATARRGELMVRDDAVASTGQVAVVLDPVGFAPPADGPRRGADSLDDAATLLVSLAADLVAVGRDLAVTAGHDSGLNRQVESSVLDLQRDLARYVPAVDVPVPSVPASGDVLLLLGVVGAERARAWIRAIDRPASVIVVATTEAAVRDELRRAGWALAVQHPNEPPVAVLRRLADQA